MNRIVWLACLLGLMAGPAWGQAVSGGGSLPIATTTVLGGIKPDGTTITVDGSTGVATSIGGSATTITPGTTTVVGATAPCLIENSATTVMACPGVGTGIVTALGINVGTAGAPVILGGAGGTPSSLTLTNATGLPDSGIVAQTANTVMGALTAVSPSGLAVPSCSTASSALEWTSGTGFGCNSSITAAATPVTGITGLGTGVATALGDATNATGGFGTVGTSGTNIGLLNANKTDSGNNSFSGTYAQTSTSLPTQAAGTLGVGGEATKPTLAANGEGDVYLTSTTGGLTLIGKGSTNDLTVFNDGGTSVCTVATGTTNWNCTGLQVGGTAVSTATAANPSATAGPTANNGSATTWMRSDATPPVQKGSASQFGIVEADGTTITASAGVLSAVGGAATSITPGTTTIVGATAPCIIQNSTSTTMACSPAAGSLVSITDTTHTTSASAANIGGQDDYNGSSITGTLATLASGQTLFVTDQNATALTISNNSQTVNGLPLSTTLHTGGFYGYTYNTTTSQISGYGFPGFGTITSGALMEFDDATGAATAGPTPGTGVATALGDAVNTTGGIGTIGTSGAHVGLLNAANVFSAQQSSSITTLSISTATFTPDGTNNDYTLTLVHASCPCTLANPSVTPVPGTHGVIFVAQSSTGSDTIGTWGSDYEAPGGTASITLSTGASAQDALAYVVLSTSKILLMPALTFSH